MESHVTKEKIFALRQVLAEYDVSRQRCNIEHWRVVADCHHRMSCVRPAGHDGECKFSRPVLGWPGFETIKELLDIADRVAE